jgi:NADPH:quinone reductase-like Zn-dependent oxidoreductase
MVYRCRSLTVHPQKYPLVLGFDSAGVVEAIGQGVTGWNKGDRVSVLSLHLARVAPSGHSLDSYSVHEGFFTDTSRSGTFQQYTLVPADLAAKVCDKEALPRRSLSVHRSRATSPPMPRRLSLWASRRPLSRCTTKAATVSA